MPTKQNTLGFPQDSMRHATPTTQTVDARSRTNPTDVMGHATSNYTARARLRHRRCRRHRSSQTDPPSKPLDRSRAADPVRHKSSEDMSPSPGTYSHPRLRRSRFLHPSFPLVYTPSSLRVFSGMQRLDSSPAHDTTTEDFLILVTKGSHPDLPPDFLTKSGVKGPLRTPVSSRKVIVPQGNRPAR